MSLVGIGIVRPYAIRHLETRRVRSHRSNRRQSVRVRAAVTSGIEWDVVAKELETATPLIIMDHVGLSFSHCLMKHSLF